MQRMIKIFKYDREEPFKGKNLEEMQQIIEQISPILNGFKEFEFENSEETYDIVKNIVLMILYSYSEEIENFIYIFIKNYNELLGLIKKFDYIDRIKILISFIIRILYNIESETDVYGNIIVSYDYLDLIDIDNENTYKKYPFVKNAFDIFYNIIDDLTEDSPFFQGILQFNSKIYNEVISGENFHSGTILNINDIKLELVKNINRFLFLSNKRPDKCDDFAIFYDKSLLVIMNLYSFFDNKYDLSQTKNYNDATCIILFLLFHECFGHQKKNINNENTNTPRKHYDKNFNEIKEDKVDSGLAFEKILFGECVNLNILKMKKGKLGKLLESNLYTGKNFDNLRKIYLDIKKEENEIKEITKSDSEKFGKITKQKEKIFDKTKVQKKRKEMFHDLLGLFSNLNENEKESLKDNEDYQRFLILYEKRKNPPPFKLPRFMQNFHKKI